MENIPKILLIDNDRDNLDAMSLVLRFNKYRTYSFLNGDHLIERTRAIVPDMLIIDVLLGAEDGRDLCRQIKSTPDICHIPILIISANKSLLCPMDCQAEGSIEKPFNIDHLFNMIDAHLLVH